VSVVIDESTLYRRFGDNAVMRGQLLRLEELTALPNVTLQVLPLAGTHPIGTGAFSYLQFDPVHDVPLADMVEVEHLTGAYYPEGEEQVFRYRVTFESLTATAMDKDLAENEDGAVRAGLGVPDANPARRKVGHFHTGAVVSTERALTPRDART
jgi:hypothetical protein